MTKRHDKHADGLYHIKGKTYKLLKGSRQQVWNKTAYKTDGTPGLTRDKLLYNKKTNRIVSKSKSLKMKKENGKRFKSKGYDLNRTKGTFGVNKIGSKRKSPKKNSPKNKTKRSKK